MLERRGGGLPGHCSSLFESSELVLFPTVLGVTEALNGAEPSVGHFGHQVWVGVVGWQRSGAGAGKLTSLPPWG